mgnify:CR=1 FL=1
MSLLEIKNVNISYHTNDKTVYAVQDVSLSVEEEESVDPYLEEDDELVKTKVVTLEKMDLDEAIMRMEMLGHTFFIYLDDETNSSAVVYKRNDGGYGLIETE